MEQIIIRSGDIRDSRVSVYLTSTIQQVLVLIWGVIILIQGVRNLISHIVTVISHIPLYFTHRSHHQRHNSLSHQQPYYYRRTQS